MVVRIVFLYPQWFPFARVNEMCMTFVCWNRYIVVFFPSCRFLYRFRTYRLVLYKCFAFSSFPQVRFSLICPSSYFPVLPNLIRWDSMFRVRIIANRCSVCILFRGTRSFCIQAIRPFMRLVRFRRCANVHIVRTRYFFRWNSDFIQAIRFIRMDR